MLLVSFGIRGVEAEVRVRAQPGTRVVMESFSVEGWKPVQTEVRGYKTFYLYAMPPGIAEQDGQEAARA